MPRNGAGIFSLPPVYQAVPGTTIRAEQHNSPLEDIAAALTNSLPRDGQAPMTGDLPMGSNKITGLAAGTNPADAVRFDQLPPALTGWLASVSALALTANQFPYATDATTAAAADMGAFGKAFLETADITEAWNELYLGSLAGVSPTGTPDGTKFLRDDGSWQEVERIGEGQTWQDMTSSRSASTSYQNTTGRPIEVAIVAISNSTARDVQVSPDGSSWVTVGLIPGSTASRASLAFIVPNTWRYRIDGAVNANMTWAELR